MTYEIKWTIEEIKRGFEAFLEAHRRYPTALDIDQYELLPLLDRFKDDLAD